MQDPLQHFLIVTPLALLALWFYARLARGVLRGETSQLPWIPFRPGDTIFVSILSLFFIINLIKAGESSGSQTLTPDAVLYAIIYYLVLIVFILGFLWFRNLNPLEVFGFRNSGWPRKGFFALGCLLAVYPMIALAQLISYTFFTKGAAPQQVVSFLVGSEASSYSRTLIILLAIVVAPIAEELIFRGYLYGVFRKFAGRLPAILFCSILFAAIHLHLPSMFALIILAIALTLVYERTGSLWAPILMHATFNALSVLAATYWPELLSQ
ncbi:MAG: lysostaphin resistance A-like protein [Chthoniobacterales bacterium]